MWMMIKYLAKVFKISIQKISIFIQNLLYFYFKKFLGLKFQNIQKSNIVTCNHLNYLQNHLKQMRPYNPTNFLPTPQMQMISLSLAKDYYTNQLRKKIFGLDFKKQIQYEQKFDFTDKGSTKFQWYKPHCMEEIPNEHKTLLVVHPGLNQDTDLYVPFLIKELINSNQEIVIIHGRGDYNTKSDVRNFYDMTNHLDMVEIQEYLKSLSQKQINSVGLSVGGCQLVYQIATKKTGIVSNAMTINSPLDMLSCVQNVCPFGNRHIGNVQKDRIQNNFDQVFQKYKGNKLKEKMKEFESSHTSNFKNDDDEKHKNDDDEKHKNELNQKLLNASSLHDITEGFSGQLLELEGKNYENVQEWQFMGSATTFLDNTNPTTIVIVNDLLDPIATWHNFSRKRLSMVSNVIFLETEFGSHLGYVESLFGKNQMAYIVREWLDGLHTVQQSKFVNINQDNGQNNKQDQESIKLDSGHD